MDDEVVASGSSAHVPGALFVKKKKNCHFLAILDVVSGMTIGCIRQSRK
jgi:hypothetical protein